MKRTHSKLEIVKTRELFALSVAAGDFSLLAFLFVCLACFNWPRSRPEA